MKNETRNVKLLCMANFLSWQGMLNNFIKKKKLKLQRRAFTNSENILDKLCNKQESFEKNKIKNYKTSLLM